MTRTPKRKPESSPSPATDERNKDYKKALNSLTRHLAFRDHSVLELRTKLSQKYDPELVETLLSEAAQKGWLLPEHEIAERLALSLARRHKSQMYIDEQLRKRGLPPVPKEPETESIRRLVERKFGTADLHGDEKEKAIRFLASRGFEEYAVRQVLDEKREG